VRVLVCGDRGWSDRGMVYAVLRVYPPGTVVIEGEARGADTCGRLAAQDCGFIVERYPARWSTYGRAAGPIRNQQMLDEGKPDVVEAFHDHIRSSKGIRDMVQRAEKAGIPVRIHKHGA
jgi:hypothetical protein